MHERRLSGYTAGGRLEIVMNTNVVRFDAPFWVALLASAIFVGSVGCLSLAAAAQDAAKSDIAIVSAGDT